MLLGVFFGKKCMKMNLLSACNCWFLTPLIWTKHYDYCYHCTMCYWDMILWKIYMWKKLCHCQGPHPFWYSAFKLCLNSVQWAPCSIYPASVTIQPMQMWCKLIPVLKYFPRKCERVGAWQHAPMLNYSLPSNSPTKSFVSPLDFTCGQLQIKRKKMQFWQCYSMGHSTGKSFWVLVSSCHLAEGMHKTTANVKTGPEASPHIFNPEGSWQSEGMVIDGASSTSCIRQIKCLPGTVLLPNMSLSSVRGQLWNTDSWYSQDRWDGVKSPSSYKLCTEEMQIVYGYPRYLNGHLRWHVP